MKLWKKKSKKEDVVIYQPKANGLKTLSYPSKEQNPKSTPKNRSRHSLRGTRNSKSSARSRPNHRSIGGESELDLDSDDTDFTYSDDDETVGEASRRSSRANFGKSLPRAKKKKKPIVNSCCGFCSLGAGSLITGLFYMCFGIGFLVFRINDFNDRIGRSKVIYTGNDFYKDVWKLILIGGMAVSGISMIGAFMLLIASCVFGQKEHYRKMRIAIIIWCILTALSVLWNVGEGVFVTLIPKEYSSTSTNNLFLLNSDKIKAVLPTVWALTGIYGLFYIYLVIVLVSYLRLLKYQKAPKVGGNDLADEIKNNPSMSRLNSSMSIRSRTDNTSILRSVSSRFAETSINRNANGSIGSRTTSQLSNNGATLDTNGSAYMNWTQVKSIPMPIQANDSSVQNQLSSSIYDVPSTKTHNDDRNKDSESIAEKAIENFSEAIIASNEVIDSATIATNTTSENTKLSQEGTVSATNQMKPDLNNDFDSDPINLNADDSMYSTPRSDPVKRSYSSSTQESDTREVQDSRSKLNEENDKPEKKVEPAVVSTFFRKLSNETATNNPIEEMFRLFGGDLCSQHPENCERYLKSYKDVRSKSSHLSSLRDPYEFEKLGKHISEGPSRPQQISTRKETGSMQIFNNNEDFNRRSNEAVSERFYPVQQFSMGDGSNRFPDSIYSQSSGQLIQVPSRHSSHMSSAPEPVYDFHLHSRTSRNNHQFSDFSYRGDASHISFDKQRTVSNRYPQYYDRHPNSVYSYDYNYDPYYVESCSTCYGDYIYGDYSDYYSFSDYYPSQKQDFRQFKGYQMYDPLPWSRTNSHNPSVSQFSTMPNPKRNVSQNTASTSWIPIDANDNYSIDQSYKDWSFSEKTLSLPNLAGRSRSKTPVQQKSRELFAPLSPEFTLPSPRESNKLSRSSSWSSSQHQFKQMTQDARESSFGRNSTSRRSSAMLRNYSGYHTGDLRSRTSHTFNEDNDLPFSSFSGISRDISIQSRRSSRPLSSRRDETMDYFSDRTKSRSSVRSRSIRDTPLPPTPSSDSFFRSSRPQSFIGSEFSYPSESTFRNYDPYPDKHVIPTPSKTSLNSVQQSLAGSRAIVPYNSSSRKAEKKKTDTFNRTRSARFEARLPRTNSKQVKFGSTSDLHRI